MAPDHTNHTRSGASADTTSGLFSRLIGDAAALVRNEVALAKSEFAAAATNAKLGVMSLAVSAVVLLAGALSLIAALVLGLAEIVDPWVAALIVGVALTAIGIGMLQAAKKKFNAIAPLSRTQTSLQQDAALIARRI